MGRETFLEGIFFGQRHHRFCWDDYELCRKIKRLSLKYHRLCVAQANGEISNEAYHTEDKKIIEKVKMLIEKRAHESTNKTGTFTIEFYDLGFGLLYDGDNVPLNLI